MARGKQENKPTRKQKRMRPTQPKSKPSCPFLSLPLELTDAVVNHLPNSDSLLALVLTCTAFYHRYRLRLVVDRYKECHSFAKAYCLEGAEEGEFGWKPFTIDHAEYGARDYMEEEDPDHVFLMTIEHDIAEFHEDKPTRDYFVLDMMDNEIVWDHDYCEWSPDASEDYRDWDDIRGRLQQATPELMRERFGPCPECKGSGDVIYGSTGVAKRWPEIPQSDIFFEGPCPRCTFSYSFAVEHNRDMINEFEMEMEAYMEEYEAEMM